MLCSLSTKLDEKSLKTIKELEKDLGKTLLAFSCYPVKAADIDNDQLAKIQKTEKDLGISLVAVGQ